MRLTAAAASALALGLVLAFSGHVAGQGFVGSSGSCSCNETTTLLDCSSIGLLSLNGNISACQSLEAILLDHNQLSFLPSNYFDELTTLQKLDLSFNQFFFIPGDYFGNQTSLVILDLSHNFIVQGGIAADAFANMISLESLNISGNNPLTVNADLFANLINLLTLTCNGVVTCTNGAGANVTCPNTGAVSDSDLNLLFDCLMMSTTTATPASTTAVTTTTAPAVVTTTDAASATTTAAASGTTTAAAPGTTTAASATTTAAAPATTTTAAANGTTTAFQCPPVDASSCQISATKRWARDANGCWFCFDYASTTAAPPTSSGSGPTTTPFQCPPIVASSCQISATKKWALDANGCWFCFDFASTAAPATTTGPVTTTAATTSVPTTTAATTTVATTTLPTTGAATTGAANTTTVATTQPATGATTNAPVTLGVATNSSVKVVIQGNLGSCSCNATSTVLDCSNLGLNDSSIPANIAASCPNLVSVNLTGNNNLTIDASDFDGLNLASLSCTSTITCTRLGFTFFFMCPTGAFSPSTAIPACFAAVNSTTTVSPANTTTANPNGGNATTTVAPPTTTTTAAPATTTTAAPSGGSTTTTVFKCPPISALSCNISDTKRWALDANGCWFCFDYASTAPASTSTGSASVPTTVAATTTTTTTAAAASTTVTETRPLNQTTTETRPPLNQTTTASSAQTTTTTAAPAGGSTTTTVFKCPPISALSCNISDTKRWALDANGCWFCFDYASTAPASPPTTTTTGRPTTTTVKPTTAKPTTTTAKATTTAKTTAKPVTTTTAKPATTSSNAAGSGGFTCPPLYRANCPNGNIRWALDARGCWYSFCG